MIAPDGDTDDWTIELDPGQTITVLLRPTSSLTGTVEVLAPDYSVLATASAESPGETVLLQTVAASGSGIYTIRTGGAFGSTGEYSYEVYLNTALENESHGGPGNDEPISAQSIDASFIDLATGGSRGAVLGTTPGAPQLVEIEPNNGPVTDLTAVQNIDDGPWNLDFDPNIEDSQLLPHVSIAGAGDGTFDYYSFTASQPFSSAIFDIDATEALDSYLYLYDSSGNLLFENDDFGFDPGSSSGFDSQLSVFLFNPGTYIIGVGSYPFGSPVPSGASYTLHVSVENHPLGTASGGSDIYSFTLGENQSASVVATSISDDDVDIELLDATGAHVATGSHAGTNISEVIEFAGGMSGTYYVRVSGGSNTDYSLVVMRNSQFDIEENDTIDTAQALDLLSGGANILGHSTGQSLAFVTASGYPNSILLVDTSIGEIVDTIPAPIPVGSLYDGLGYDGGNLFLTNPLFDDVLYEIDPVSGTIVDSDALGIGFGPNSGVAVLNGLVYVSNSGTGEIVVFDPRTDSIVNTLNTGISSFAGGLAAISGPDALVARNGSQIVLIDPANGSITSDFFIPDDGFGLGVVDDRILVSRFEGVSAYSRDGNFLSNVSLPFSILAIGADNLQSSPVPDFYSITLSEASHLNISTGTPGGGAGQFLNELDPVVRIYDDQSLFIAEDDNSADGRNAALSLLDLPVGTYYVEVSGLVGTTGEYTLTVDTTVAASVSVTPPTNDVSPRTVGSRAGVASLDHPSNTFELRDFDSLFADLARSDLAWRFGGNGPSAQEAARPGDTESTDESSQRLDAVFADWVEIESMRHWG